MTYQVLARKWRPRDFASLVGQDHVVRALTHALDQQRLHHAYLFTGTRGVGKTTLSRILAKALNCETGITSQPCGVCRACTEIDAGRFVDYVEMDAASNRGVDEMAALLERAIYAPVDARFKVYMIDEVHMLTNHAFNAMLKTLEEPPAHVKFILATTDPQKIPVTVLSRCLQFNLKQMPAGDIVTHLDKVLHAEGIDFELQALRLLSRAADGSMRDALSLTDQAIAYAAGSVNEEAVRGMLGALDQHYLMRLLDGIVASDGAAVLAVADEMASRSLSFSIALQDLAQWLNRIGWAQFAPASVLEEWPEAADIRRFAQTLHPEQVQLFYQIATIGRSELGLAPDEYAGFTMTLLRMLAFRPLTSLSGTSGGDGGQSPRAASSGPGGAAMSTMSAAALPQSPAAKAVAATAAAPVPSPVAVSSRPATAVAIPSTPPVVQAQAIAPVPEAMPIPRQPITPPMATLATRAASLPGSDAKADEDRLLMDAFSASPAPMPPPAPPMRSASPAQAALEALGALRGKSAARPSVAAKPPGARPASAAVEQATPRNTARAPMHAPAASADDGFDDGGPPWEAAPWDDDGAAAFLSSMQEQAPSVGRQSASAARQPIPSAPAMQVSTTSEPVTASSAAPVLPATMRRDVSDGVDGQEAPALPDAISLAAVGFTQDWPSLAAQLDVKGLAQQLAYQSELVGIDNAVTPVRLMLRIPVAQLASGAHVEKVLAALTDRLGQAVALQIDVGAARRTAAALDAADKAERQRRAEESIRNDPFVQTLLRDFDASILPGATQPLANGTASAVAAR